MTEKPTVALIGAGAMGGALLKGWLKAGSIDAARSAVFDPNAGEAIAELCVEHGAGLNPDNAGAFEALVVAVKPQVAEAVLPAYAPLAKRAVVISVMAGKSVASVAEALGGAAKVARAMPNLPAAIGKGVSGLYAPDAVDAREREMIETLMRAAGETVWTKSEDEIDAVTAVSGSGPAYFFLMTEALAQAGEALGLDPEAAARLALATLVGAGALMQAESRTPTEMRRAVTSPGGTTEAALSILDGDSGALRRLMKDAVAAAAKRAGELTA